MLDDGVEVKRRIVEDLRPALLDNLGLGAAITWHVEQMSERSGLDCTVLVPEDDSPLPGHIAIALFRVVQEALTNVLRHAKATRASVELQRTINEVRLEITDDGAGMPPGRPRVTGAHGIMSMRQRILGVGGEFDMRSGEGGGTTIVVRVPLEQDAREENTPQRETQTAE
jgi:signal transduction histidine kinase